MLNLAHLRMLHQQQVFYKILLLVYILIHLCIVLVGHQIVVETNLVDLVTLVAMSIIEIF